MVKFANIFFILILLLLSCKPKNVQNSTVKLVNAVDTKEADELFLQDIVKLSINNDYYSCTGTFLSSSTLITASHCIDFSKGTTYNSGEVYYMSKTGISIKSTRVFVRSDTFTFLQDRNNTDQKVADTAHNYLKYLDVAIVVFPPNTGVNFAPYRSIATTDPIEKEKVFLVAFGTSNYNSTYSSDKELADDLKATKRWGNNTINKVYIDEYLSYLEILQPNSLKSPGSMSGVYSGDSGSPLIRGTMLEEKNNFTTNNKKGELLGIASQATKTYAWYTNLQSAPIKELFNNAIYCSTPPCADNFLNIIEK